MLHVCWNQNQPASGVMFDNGKGGLIVGRATSIYSHNTIEVNVCPLVDYALLKKSPPSKDAMRTSFELYQSSKVTSIPTSCVCDVEFIFTISYIESWHEDLVGINNAYYMCFQKISDDGVIEDIPNSHCLPFASSYCREHQHLFCLHSQL
jgi:hypothetical protein